MATETFVIKIQQTGAEQAAAQIGKVEQAATKASKSVSKTTEIMAFFRKALVAFSAFKAAQVFVEFVDSVQSMDNRLKQATKSTAEFARAQQFLAKISRETSSEIVGNTTVYSRLLIATEKLKLSSNDAETVMSTLTKSIAVAGATSDEARNALQQFAQGLASGSLRGQDLNSVVSFLPPLAKAIAKEFGITGGELRSFANNNAGIISTEKIMRAVLKNAGEMDEAFKKMTPTITQGFINVGTALRLFIRDINSGTGASSLLYAGLNLVANNIAILITAFGTLAALKIGAVLYAWGVEAVVFGGKILVLLRSVTSLTAAVALFNTVMAMNPLVLLGIAIAAVIAALVYLYQTVPAVTQFFNGLWESLKSFGSFLVDTFAPVWDVIMRGVNALRPSFQALIEVVGSVVEGWGILAKMWYDTIGWLTPLGVAIKNHEALLSAIAYVVQVTLIGAFSALIYSVQAVAEVFHAFGFVTEETITKMRTGVISWQEYANAVITGKDAIAAATEPQKQLGSAAEGVGTAAVKAKDGVVQFNDGMDDMGQLSGAPISVLDSLGLTLDTIAPAAARTADSLNKTSEATWTIEESGKAADDIMKKLNPSLFEGKDSGEAAAQGFYSAGTAADNLTGKINRLAEAYRQLRAASGGEGNVSGGGLDGENANGGPVRRGGVYLVGEKGPEIFTPGVSGYISSNDDSLAMMSNAANSNIEPLSGTGSNKVAKAMIAAANSTAESASYMANSVAKWVMTDWKDSKSASGLKGYDPDIEAILAQRGGITKYDGRIVSGSHQRPDGYNPLPGDADYVADLRAQNLVHYTQGAIPGARDNNDPFTHINLMAQKAYKVLGNQQMGDDYMKLYHEQIARVKEIRDNTAALKEFKKTYEDALGTPTDIDFQTLLPMLGLGGTMHPEADPYGLMKQASQPMPSSANHSSGGEESGSKKKSGDNFTVVLNGVQDFQSFRNNRAQVEAGIYGAVKRAARRAGV